MASVYLRYGIATTSIQSNMKETHVISGAIFSSVGVECPEVATRAPKTAEKIQRGGRVSEGATTTMITVLVLVFGVALLVARLN